MERGFLKEPYDVIEARLKLSQLAIELLGVTKEKWKNHDSARIILKKEEDLIRQIQEVEKEILNLIEKT